MPRCCYTKIWRKNALYTLNAREVCINPRQCQILQQEPKDVTVDVGSSVLFDCRVSGEPQPQISWKKKNDQMPVARAYIAKDNRGLRIDRWALKRRFLWIYSTAISHFRVQVSDEGDYVCYARNPAGSIESSARLKVQVNPWQRTEGRFPNVSVIAAAF